MAGDGGAFIENVSEGRSPARDLGCYLPLQRLAEHWQRIREEAVQLSTDEVLLIDRQGKAHKEVLEEIERGGKAGWVRAWGPTKDLWLNYGIIFRDRPVFGHTRLPFTTSLLMHLRGIKIAALSLFRPGACLPIHDHPELADERLLTFHLPLQTATPSHSFLCTEGTFLLEQAGNALVFDGSKPHFAFNCSNETRLILYLEFSPSLLRWVK